MIAFYNLIVAIYPEWNVLNLKFSPFLDNNFISKTQNPKIIHGTPTKIISMVANDLNNLL